jgi:hypothetical protein
MHWVAIEHPLRCRPTMSPWPSFAPSRRHRPQHAGLRCLRRAVEASAGQQLAESRLRSDRQSSGYLRLVERCQGLCAMAVGADGPSVSLAERLRVGICRTRRRQRRAALERQRFGCLPQCECGGLERCAPLSGLGAFACNDGYVYTSPVGTFKASAFGLNDMLGNVFQWTEDCWNANYIMRRSTVPRAPTGNCAERELRGGSWFSSPEFVRADYRNHFGADYRASSVGHQTGQGHCAMMRRGLRRLARTD